MRKPVLTAALVVSAVLVSACSVAKPSAPVPNPSGGATVTPAPVTDPPKVETPPVQVPKVEEPPKPVKREMPKPVRGIHVSGWIGGSPDRIGPLLEWAKSVGINTVVLEVKAEDGKVSWKSDVPLAIEIGANESKIGDIEKLVKEMHNQGFWVAGRVVVMNDQFLYKGRPAWGIPGFPGGAYSFMDPKNENVWQYNIDLAKAAVKVGMDEIQFDYIRYPEKLVNGYNRDTDAAYRTGNINGFLKKAMAELKPLGVVVGADLFGLTTSVAEGDDMQIGQDYRQVAEIVDYVAAMAYPSHYANGTYGIPNPDAAPGETVKASMEKALQRTQGIPIEKHRPWIQDFTYPAKGYIPYGINEVSAQVKALKSLGIDSFILWDPSNKYTRGLDYTKL